MDVFSSFRSAIDEKLAPFAAPFGDIEKDVKALLAESVVRVANSREEGVSFSSALFIVSDLDHLLKLVEGTQPIRIGHGAIVSSTVRMAMKSLIPLAEGRQWAIYFLIKNNQLEYGLFCTQRSSLKLTSFESLRMSHEDSAKPVVGIVRLGEHIVEVRGSNGDYQYLDFSGTADLDRNPREVVKAFTKNVSCDSDPKIRALMEAFYYRIAVEVLNGSHGALVAVMKKGEPRGEFLADGIWLEKPISLEEFVRNYENSRSEFDSLSLIAMGSLIRRMISMDGIMVLSTDGNVLAYNCFIREQLAGPPSRSVIGGARRRAYSILCGHLGSKLQAVVYRSQDGFAECKTDERIKSASLL